MEIIMVQSIRVYPGEMRNILLFILFNFDRKVRHGKLSVFMFMTCNNIKSYL